MAFNNPTSELVTLTPASDPKASTRETRDTSQSRLVVKKKSKNVARHSSSRYDNRLADAALRQAAEGGYLISPSRSFLLERCQTRDGDTQSLRDIIYLHLAFTHIRTLGHIQSCRHLTICILHNNYLTRFNALANCPELVRLDLHSNQITKLPDETFWCQLRNLKILNLHDNGFGNLDSVQGLAACSRLTALTLYDSPVFLKPSYRHHTVNSIWSLKALDHHVISDEEIIEDSHFTGKFSCAHPNLKIDLCPKEKIPSQQRTLKLEMNVVKQILAKINKILVHGSPVIVIQRWIRGHLARKRLGIRYKAINEKMQKYSRMSMAHRTPGDGYNIDYDTYMENRRPGSRTPTGERSRMTGSVLHHTEEAGDADDTLQNLPTSLHINLAKLEKLALQKLFQQSPDLSEIVQITRPGDEKRIPDFADQKKDASVKAKQRQQQQDKLKKRDPQTVQQMLGPKESLVQPPITSKCQAVHGTTPLDLAVKAEEIWVNGEQPQHKWRVHSKQFRLGGYKPPFMEIDPVQDHLIMNQEAGRDVREAEDFWHEQKENRPTPFVVKFKPEPKLKDHVSLATLIAVSKAYKDRDRADELAMKMDRVMKIQQEKIQSRHIVNAYKEERRNYALNKRQEDRIRVTRALQQQEMNRASYIEFAQERKEKSFRRHQNIHKDLMFATDFSNQHTSVSSALLRHDQQSNMEDLISRKKSVVKGIKTQLAEQSELVRRYMEHKQLMTQLASGQERAQLGTRALQEANERILLSKQRVAAMKARKAAMQAYHHQPPASANPTEWQGIISRNSLRSDGLHPSPTLLGDSGVILPPTPRQGGAPNVTPRKTTHSMSFTSPRPKTTAVVQLPPVAPNMLSSRGVTAPKGQVMMSFPTTLALST